MFVDFSNFEIFYHLIKRGSSEQQFDVTIQGVVGGEHRISFFVVEESGLPFNRTASMLKIVTVENGRNITFICYTYNTLIGSVQHYIISVDIYAGTDSNKASIEYSLESNSSGVCITCTFLDSSATDCVAVVHQRISQLSSSGLMNIESSHKFTRSGDTASGCIEAVNMDDYQVGVAGAILVSSTLSRGIIKSIELILSLT